MEKSNISKPSLRRLPVYLSYLKTLPRSTRTISATAVAAALGLNEVQVRKDLSAASRSGGRPKMGYSVEELIADLEEFLGYRNTKDAILIGVGRLGGALLSFKGFAACGMRIAAAFADAGLGPTGCCESPVHGHRGNVEYLLCGQRGAARAALDLKAVVSGGAVALA